MTGILGRKLGMTQVFDESGRMYPVTVVEAGPCCVVQIKTKEHDGYEALKVGYGEIKKEKNVTNAMKGLLRKPALDSTGFSRSFRCLTLRSER